MELELKIMELKLNWWNGIDPNTVVGYILIMNQQTWRWKNDLIDAYLHEIDAAEKQLLSAPLQ